MKKIAIATGIHMLLAMTSAYGSILLTLDNPMQTGVPGP